jgi:phosphoglycolate phosphatase-like HAD superfamily hydrolase
MIRVVVFDFDGTLADTNAVKEECTQRTVAGLPGGPSVLETARQSGGDRYKVFADVARRVWHGAAPEMIADQTRVLVESYSNCCTQGIVAAAERRGARSALDALRRRGLPRYILSATPDRHLREVLLRRGLLSRVNGALGSSVTKEKGPAADHRQGEGRARFDPARRRQCGRSGRGPDDWCQIRGRHRRKQNRRPRPLRLARLAAARSADRQPQWTPFRSCQLN